MLRAVVCEDKTGFIKMNKFHIIAEDYFIFYTNLTQVLNMKDLYVCNKGL